MTPMVDKSIYRKIQGATFWIGLVSSLLGLSVAFVWLKEFVAPREFELVVWIKEAVPLYPSDATGDLSLPFQVDTLVVESASVLNIQVKNFGSNSIGNQLETWSLELISLDGASLILLGKPSASVPLVLKYPEGVTSASLPVTVGLFEPGAQVEFRLLLLNDPNPGRPRLDAEWSLKGLSGPLTTWSAPNERMALQFFPGMFIAWAIILGIVWYFDYKRNPRIIETKGKLLGGVLMLIFGAAFLGFVSAHGLGTVMSWIL